MSFLTDLLEPAPLRLLKKVKDRLDVEPIPETEYPDITPELAARLKEFIAHIESLPDNAGRLDRINVLAQAGQHERQTNLRAVKDAARLLHYITRSPLPSDESPFTIALAVVGFGVHGVSSSP